MDAKPAGQPVPRQSTLEAPPATLPAPVPTEAIPAELPPAGHPLTAADLAADNPPKRERRLKPIYRERSPAVLAEERAESEDLKHG
jgi:hypothetical protein